MWVWVCVCVLRLCVVVGLALTCGDAGSGSAQSDASSVTPKPLRETEVSLSEAWGTLGSDCGSSSLVARWKLRWVGDIGVS